MATDDFNRTDETPIAAPWARLTSSSGNINLSSNRMRSSADGDKFYYYSAAAASADHYAECRVVNGLGTDGGAAVRVGSGGAFSGYFLDPAGGGYCKIVSGGFSNFTSIAAMSANDLLRLSVEGSTLRAYVNGAPDGTNPSTTDPSLTAIGDGPGVFLYTNQNAGDGLDDWQGGDLVAAAEKQSFYAFRRRSVTR